MPDGYDDSRKKGRRKQQDVDYFEILPKINSGSHFKINLSNVIGKFNVGRHQRRKILNLPPPTGTPNLHTEQFPLKKKTKTKPN